MTRLITANPSQNRYCSTVAQSVMIHRTPDKVWEEIGDFAGLAGWVRDVQKTKLLTKTKHGVGAAREIVFSDGGHVIEYAVGWADKNYISYIATSGLPLDGYHATISILQKGRASEVIWTSFLISDSQDKKKFDAFLGFIESFYSDSLKNLKAKMEKVS